MRGFRQRWNLDGVFQTLLDASGGKRLDRLTDLFAVVSRAIKVRADAAQRLAKVTGAGFAEHCLEVIALEFQQHAVFTGMHQQSLRLEQALFIEAR
ncbi:hypothetical protein D3C77_574100 [compost metagenome]